jgi:lipopolysaccharide heptosyltransferase II
MVLKWVETDSGPEADLPGRTSPERRSIAGRVIPSAYQFLIDCFQALAASIQVAVVRLARPPEMEGPSEELRRILVIKPDELGDVAMALPFLSALRQRAPRAEVTLVLNSGVAGLLKGYPGISILSVDVACNKLLRPVLLPLRHYRFARAHLRTQNFDVCLLPRRDGDDVYGTILAYFSGARRRISYTEKSTQHKAVVNRKFDALLTDVLPKPPVQHETISNLALLDVVRLSTEPTEPVVPLDAESRCFAERVIAGASASCVAICPSAGHSELKQWGADRFAEAAGILCSLGYTVVLIGTAADRELGIPIEAAAGPTCINLIGKTTLSEMAAVLTRCAAFVGNDAGPMHVAAALRIPTVGIFGSSCSHKFGAWGPRSQVVAREPECSPCRNHSKDRCKICIYTENLCLRQIPAQEVVDAVLAMIPAATDCLAAPPGLP